MERLHTDLCRIKCISIFLGNKCNLACPYCHRDGNDTAITISARLKELLANTGDVMIKFFGGEPTLYMEQIKEIVKLKPTADYAITTNGILFDKYKDYFNAHNFRVIFSFERGRPYDPLVKPIAVNRLGISTTLTADYPDIDLWQQDVTNKEDVIKRPIYGRPHLIHTLDKSNSKYALHKLDVVYLALREKEHVLSTIEDVEKYGMVNTKWFSLVTHFVRLIKNNFHGEETLCSNKECIKVDLAGNEYECLYRREPPTGPMAKCRKCRVYKWCGGGCPKDLYQLECLHNRLMIPWFLKIYKEHRGACDALVRFSRPNNLTK